MTALKMSPVPLLIATDSPVDAQMIESLLEFEFSRIRHHLDSSRPPDEPFGEEPTVLMLAFKSLRDAEHYYLQWLRSPERAPATHRTVVLCGKDAVRQAYASCRRGIYDDYVVFWPFSDDMSRLPMALHRAAEQLQNLPRLDPAAAAAAVDGRIDRESTVPPGAPVVLVADDDEYQSKLIGRILEKAGYQLIFARNGYEALAQAGAAHPDVILLDYVMPDLDGLQVMEQLARLPRISKIPVVMVTGNSQRDLILSCRKLGAVEYLVKPFESRALLAKLARVLTHV